MYIQQTINSIRVYVLRCSFTLIAVHTKVEYSVLVNQLMSVVQMDPKGWKCI